MLIHVALLFSRFVVGQRQIILEKLDLLTFVKTSGSNARLSRYTVTAPFLTSQRNVLLFSTLYGTSVIIPRRILGKLKEGVPIENLKIPRKVEAILEDKFLVPENVEESSILLSRLERIRNSSDSLGIALLTTLDCNLSCKYCYQAKLKKKTRMTEKTAIMAVDWITRRIEREKSKKLSIYFYGGEPLLNMPILREVAERLREYCGQGRIEFSLDMSTNGVLLSPELAVELRKLGLVGATVNLDGPPKIHDKRRPMKDGHGTFHNILANIKKTMNILDLTVRVNVDSHNLQRVPELMSILGRERVSNNTKFDIEPVECWFGCPDNWNKYILKYQNQMKCFVHLWDEQRKHEMGIPTLPPGMLGCEFMVKNAFAIDPLGRLYKCQGFVGIEELSIGNVENDDLVYPHTMEFDLQHSNECLGCRYVPLCQGGCRIQAYMRHGSFSREFCNKDFFDYAFPKLLSCRL